MHIRCGTALSRGVVIGYQWLGRDMRKRVLLVALVCSMTAGVLSTAGSVAHAETSTCGGLPALRPGPAFNGNDGRIYGTTIAPDNRRVIAAAARNDTRITVIYALPRHMGSPILSAVSDDGSRIAFVVPDGSSYVSGGVASGGYRAYLYTRPTRTLTRLSNLPDVRQIDISADGRFIAMQDATTAGTEIVSYDTRFRCRIDSDSSASLSWSRDGQALLMDTGYNAEGFTFRVEVRTGAVTTLRQRAFAYVENPRNQSALYLRDDNDGSVPDVFRVTSPTAAPRRVFNGAPDHHSGHPRWSPSGAYFLRGGVVVRADGTASRRIFDMELTDWAMA